MTVQASQVTVGVTPVQLASISGREANVYLGGSTSVWIGGSSSVSASNGIGRDALSSGEPIKLRHGDELWAVESGSPVTVQVLVIEG